MELKNIMAGLDIILDQKKKNKKVTKKQSELYIDFWKKLLKIQGFSKLTEQYFYKGFVFMGAGPYKEYLDTLSDIDKELALKTMFQSKNFNSNVDLRFRIATSLLCELINDNLYKAHILSILLNGYREFAIKKDGIIAESVPKTIFKFLILKIDINKDSVYLEGLKLSSIKVREIRDFFNVAISKINIENNIKYDRGLKKLKLWLGTGNEDTKEFKSNEGLTTEKKKDNSEELRKKYDKECEVLKRNILSKDKEISDLKKEISNMRNINLILDDEKNAKIIEIKKLYVNYNNLAQRLESANMEIEKTRELLRLAEQKAFDEVNKKDAELASKLKPFYKTYKDCLNKKMDIELGDVLRFVLADMLKVLQKYNIKME